MDERIGLWILGILIGLVTTAILYVLRELTNIRKKLDEDLSDIRERIHAKNNDVAKLLVEIQLNVKGVSGMAKANDKSLSEIKNIVEELRKTILRLSNELSLLSGFLSKGDNHG